MNKQFILAALFGVLSYNQVIARHRNNMELAFVEMQDVGDVNDDEEQLVNIDGRVIALASVEA